MYHCLAAAKRGHSPSHWDLSVVTALRGFQSSSHASSSGGSSMSEADSDLLAPSTLKAVGKQLTEHPDLGIFSAGAAALDVLHSATGLPWWAVIPSAAVAVKTLLLPISLKQAKIVRTNMALWRESYEFVRQQEKRAKHQAVTAAATEANLSHTAATGGPQAAAADQAVQHNRQPGQQHHQEPKRQLFHAAEALRQLQQWQARLQVFHELRRKCCVPHPAWFVVNQCLQFPVFIYSSACIRYMAQANWPGFSQEGPLWFEDLTQAAVVVGQQGVQLTMGTAGLILPLAVTGVMLTSIRLGFKASGAAAKHPSISGTWLAPFLSYLPPVLYSLTLASTYLKVQLPQAVALHWLTTSSYTLSLQLGLKSPRVRRWLGYTQPNLAADAGDVEPAVAAQANAMDNADILVVMGAKHAALQRYSEGLYCLHRALQLDPQNVRAYYSAGQIHALQHQWPQSEDCYRKCAQLTADQQSRAQALYCLGVACHQQGRYQDALQAYNQAVGGGDSIQPMLVLGRVRALRELGQQADAEALAREFVASDRAKTCPSVVFDALNGKSVEDPSR
eukprot:GHUV01011026.1.p1 GENE.GHUV01011026.1~~GHUV01011026.1.p1  ORF type:complete len:561 (+),score=174.83 GHUV01011026.1:501-2183(+)